jgi:hypothetical protein
MTAPTRRLRAIWRARRRRQDDGAAAVEFALVLPILVLILFGIIDYGLYFSNSFGVRGGAQDAARQGSVANFNPYPSDCASYSPSLDTTVSSPSPDITNLMCAARHETGHVTGHLYVAVVVDPNGWAPGNSLTVCEVVKSVGITGYTPLPHDGSIQVKSVTTIEQQAPIDPSTGAPTVETSGYEALPSGDWSWCAP